MSVNDFARRLERESIKEMIDIYQDYVSALYGTPKTKNKSNFECIKNVIFNPPATIVFWADNTKTVVKCGDGDEYDPEKGLAMAIAKRALGNNGNYYNVFHKWLPKEEKNFQCSCETCWLGVNGKPNPSSKLICPDCVDYSLWLEDKEE